MIGNVIKKNKHTQKRNSDLYCWIQTVRMKFHWSYILILVSNCGQREQKKHKTENNYAFFSFESEAFMIVDVVCVIFAAPMFNFLFRSASFIFLFLFLNHLNVIYNLIKGIFMNFWIDWIVFLWHSLLLFFFELSSTLILCINGCDCLWIGFFFGDDR